MCIGDLIHVYGEDWLCMELYTDEYGITYGELWMCNHVLRFQNRTPEIINKPIIIDDGSYSKGGDKQIKITEDKFTCYISYDEESSGLFVDKRLAIDTILDARGIEVLEVGKITWIDRKSHNYGEGSHLMAFRIDNDVYNPEMDSLEESICDFIKEDAQAKKVDSTDISGKIMINGKATIKIGTGRTYDAFVIEENGETNRDYNDFLWEVDGATNGIKIIAEAEKCLINIPLEAKFIGTVFNLVCKDKNSTYEQGKITVEVIAIG